jgi:hypothetical protein
VNKLLIKICSKFYTNLDFVLAVVLGRFPSSWTGGWIWWARIWRPNAVRFQHNTSWWAALESVTMLIFTTVRNLCSLLLIDAWSVEFSGYSYSEWNIQQHLADA